MPARPLQRRPFRAARPVSRSALRPPQGPPPRPASRAPPGAMSDIAEHAPGGALPSVDTSRGVYGRVNGIWGEIRENRFDSLGALGWRR
eukprot:6938446-Pyramimonas_sp.AAC.1